MTKKQREALFLELHRAIEKAAARNASSLISKDEKLFYPPNFGLTPEEKEAIKQLKVSPTLEAALRKLFASAASEPLFKLFTLLDGTADPENFSEKWPVFRIEEKEGGNGPAELMLHDEFYESYWEWRKRRPKQSWRLDNLPGEKA